MKLLLLKTKLKSTDDRAWWPVKAPLGAIDNQLRRSNMDNIQDRMKYTEQENKILMEVSELLGHLNKDTVTTCCGTDRFHMNMFWHNGRKRLFEGQDECGDLAYWCHKCNADTSVTDDYEEEV